MQMVLKSSVLSLDSYLIRFNLFSFLLIRLIFSSISKIIINYLPFRIEVIILIIFNVSFAFWRWLTALLMLFRFISNNLSLRLLIFLLDLRIGMLSLVNIRSKSFFFNNLIKSINSIIIFLESINLFLEKLSISFNLFNLHL